MKRLLLSSQYLKNHLTLGLKMSNNTPTKVQPKITNPQQTAEKPTVAVKAPTAEQADKAIAQSQASSAPRVINTGIKAAEPVSAPKVINNGASPARSIANSNTLLGNVVAQLNKKSAPVTTKDPSEVVGDLLDHVPTAYRYPITRIYEYIKVMDPSKRENIKTGINEQSALYHSIVNIINGPEEYFEPMFKALLRLFATYSTAGGVFHEFNCSRYMQEVNMNSDERKAFNNLTCFLRLMCNPNTRKIVSRTTDHVRLLSYGLTDSGRSRVTSFLEL